MGSFVEDGIQLLAERIEELNVLLEEADKYVVSQQKLYSALCRSIQVLSVSHFEGYLKDLVKNILDDINANSDFKNSSNDLKFTYCKKFITPLATGKLNHAKIVELIAVLENLETKFDANSFYQSNKNPKESIINNIAENFGEDKLFFKLNNSDLSAVFSNTDPENILLRDFLRVKLLSSVEVYPYIQDDSILNVDQTSLAKDKFWEIFIQAILADRHKIAHGSMINSVSHTSIASNIVKIEILLLSITYLLSLRGNPVVL
ncbi:HEPN domain-containing protein [Pedobacter sp. FW305-3-2-15-E-R2A2]|uniref:HEPN domain-containing protein n=1 Tax=Pedobacter sp. FW305-3-2-15-E-R2A2 TaxID=3140251 RepID=UPI00313FFF89